MLRLACLLAVIAGCDTVFGLERDPVLHDEDGDGVDDAVDPCPQIANETTTDKDGDHVSADCDPDDQVGGTKVAFFAFDDTFPPAGISLDGDGISTQAGTIDFGTLTRFSSLTTTDITDATTVTIDVGFEILGAQIEDDPLNPVAYNEIGIYAAHRAFTTDRKQRGDTCFFG